MQGDRFLVFDVDTPIEIMTIPDVVYAIKKSPLAGNFTGVPITNTAKHLVFSCSNWSRVFKAETFFKQHTGTWKNVWYAIK